MSDNPDLAGDLSAEEAAADDAARLRDPARHAILNRASGATARALTERLAERYSIPVADDTTPSSI